MTLYYVIVSSKIFLEVENGDYITLCNLAQGDLAPLSVQFLYFFSSFWKIISILFCVILMTVQRFSSPSPFPGCRKPFPLESLYLFYPFTYSKKVSVAKEKLNESCKYNNWSKYNKSQSLTISDSITQFTEQIFVRVLD